MKISYVKGNRNGSHVPLSDLECKISHVFNESIMNGYMTDTIASSKGCMKRFVFNTSVGS